MTELFSITEEIQDLRIRPFNLDKDELEVMVKRSESDELAIVLAIMHRDRAGEANALAFLGASKVGTENPSIPKFDLAGDMKVHCSIQALPWLYENVMSPAQQAWWHNGMYVQCGFWRTILANDPWIMRGISTAMMWHDARVRPFDDHRVIDPTPLSFEPQDEEDDVPAVLARNFRLLVSDIFRERVGVWRPDLLDARNEVLIKVRARMEDADPQAEWERFKASGMSYYLDYTLIAR